MERYEHHADITNNRLCPFKLRRAHCIDDIFNWHKNIEMVMIIDGEGFIYNSTNEIPLQKGDIALISPNVMHRLYSSTNFEYYYFIVDERFWLENGIEISEYSLVPKVRDEELSALYLAMVECYQEKQKEENTINVMSLRSSAMSLLLYVLKHYAITGEKKAGTGRGTDEYIKQAIAYLNEHYAEDVSLDSIASFCGVSKYHLAREFKKHTGQTVFEYINMLRCKRASLLLAEGKSVTETAYACGYESLSYFSKVYRKRMGISPSNAKGE